MPSIYEQNAAVFKAFCDENRLRILELLQGGDLCACVLTAKLGIKQSALSYHMKVLVASGIVEGTPVGKWMHYRISEPGCETAMALLRSLTAVHVEGNEVLACPV